MKYLVKIFVITFFLFNCTNSFAEEKIVVLDLTFVLNNSKAGKGAQDYLKKSFEGKGKKFQKMQEDFKKEEKDLLAKKTVLSKEEYSKKLVNLRNKVASFNNERRTALEKITTQRAEAKETLLNKIDPILNDYIVKNDVSLVIDKKFTLGGKPENDITDIIVKKLNEELPSLNLK